MASMLERWADRIAEALGGPLEAVGTFFTDELDRMNGQLGWLERELQRHRDELRRLPRIGDLHERVGELELELERRARDQVELGRRLDGLEAAVRLQRRARDPGWNFGRRLDSLEAAVRGLDNRTEGLA